MSLKKKRTTLADKINSLVIPTPINFDSDDEAEETKAKVVDYDESDNSDNNIQVSEIRKQNAYFLDQIDKRYKGKKVSRKDIFKDNENFNIQNISENENINSIEEESDNETNDSNNEENIEDDDSNNEENIEDDDSNNEEDNDNKFK